MAILENRHCESENLGWIELPEDAAAFVAGGAGKADYVNWSPR